MTYFRAGYSKIITMLRLQLI